ncbi:hypothetical protein [Methanimicrococcus blatticola]|uniref:Uncharacterized protein n=1 Tax=Methanimicrococcus blatticola TaxID=91560 RepID=A0A484F6G9_9EURY|nr:hypothetical protein [Methanimicrococcus blatticola]MBZ3935203.1 hypothetical protein [Methanimicrococcus blatticola]MCC2508700.1 hypothetical protein [Methanimicrococcus blatticola]TDQ71264.1 hypothetical protein C7391_0371 [Methanimicrococcus blatticola]
MAIEIELNKAMILKAQEKDLQNKISALEKNIVEMEKEIQNLVKDVNVRKAELRENFENWNHIREILRDLPNDPETIIRTQFEVIFDGGIVKGISVNEMYTFGKSFKIEKEEINAVLDRMHQNGEISYPKPDVVCYTKL